MKEIGTLKMSLLGLLCACVLSCKPGPVSDPSSSRCADLEQLDAFGTINEEFAGFLAGEPGAGEYVMLDLQSSRAETVNVLEAADGMTAPLALEGHDVPSDEEAPDRRLQVLLRGDGVPEDLRVECVSAMCRGQFYAVMTMEWEETTRLLDGGNLWAAVEFRKQNGVIEARFSRPDGCSSAPREH